MKGGRGFSLGRSAREVPSERTGGREARGGLGFGLWGGGRGRLELTYYFLL